MRIKNSIIIVFIAIFIIFTSVFASAFSFKDFFTGKTVSDTTTSDDHEAAASVCNTHHQYKCYNNHVYWQDSCGQIEEKKEYCAYGCEDSSCINVNAKQTSYPAPFVSGGAANVAIIIGSKATAADTLAGTDISTSLQSECTKQKSGCKLGGVAAMDSEISSVKDKNLIVIGRPCENEITSKILGIDASLCNEDKSNFASLTCLAEGQFLIKSVPSPYNSDKIALIIMGYSAADTKSAASYILAKKPDTTIGTSMIKNANYESVKTDYSCKEEIKTCSNLGGSKCEENYECNGEIKKSGDTTKCCVGECRIKTKETECNGDDCKEDDKNNSTTSLITTQECNSGCIYKEKCIPFGMRAEGKYCSILGVLEKQKQKEEICENNYECKSNVCLNGKCLSQGFVQKILEWLKQLFGIKET
ncbi:MAG: hypothetical protein V1660_00725 [archaeon]